jgi:hypothetical protein
MTVLDERTNLQMDVLAWWLKLVGRIANRSRESPPEFSGTSGCAGAPLR